MDSFLQLLVELKLDEPTRRVGVETSTQRIQDAVQTNLGTHIVTVPSIGSPENGGATREFGHMLILGALGVFGTDHIVTILE